MDVAKIQILGPDIACHTKYLYHVNVINCSRLLNNTLLFIYVDYKLNNLILLLNEY